MSVPMKVFPIDQCYTIIRFGGDAISPPSATLYTKIPNFKELLMKEVQKQHKDYNPNPGYEPYWPKGVWVFEDDDLKKYGSTTKMQLVCGEECNYLFKSVKKVCAKQVHVQSKYGCTPNLFTSCTGYYPDTLSGFHTFDTYCEFLNEQCHTSFDYYWILIHVGACMERINMFKPMQEPDRLYNRLYSYLSTLEEVFFNASLPSPLGTTGAP